MRQPDMERLRRESLQAWAEANRRALHEAVRNTPVNQVVGDGSTGSGGGDLSGLVLVFDDISSAHELVGDAGSVDDWNDFFGLPANGVPFTRVLVTGSSVKLFGGSGITLTNGDNFSGNLFSYNLSILEVDDQAGCITALGDGVFYSADNLVSARFNSAITAGDYVFGSDQTSLLSTVEMNSLVSGTGVFYDCPGIVSISLPALQHAQVAGYSDYDGFFYGLTNCTVFNLPSLVTADDYCFNNCGSVTDFNLPSLLTAGSQCFTQCSAMTSLSMPVCIGLGINTGNNNVFSDIFGNTINLTIPAALMTCNAGGPDGDIVYLQAHNTVNITTI